MSLFDIGSIVTNSSLTSSPVLWFTFRNLALYALATVALYHAIRKARQFYKLFQAMERFPGPSFTYNPFLGNLYVLTGNDHIDLITREYSSIFLSFVY